MSQIRLLDVSFRVTKFPSSEPSISHSQVKSRPEIHDVGTLLALNEIVPQVALYTFLQDCWPILPEDEAWSANILLINRIHEKIDDQKSTVVLFVDPLDGTIPESTSTTISRGSVAFPLELKKNSVEHRHCDHVITLKETYPEKLL